MPHVGSASEVDFVVRQGDELVAIEVKASPHVDSRALKPLRSVGDLQGLRRRILICGVTRPELTEDGIEVWPFLHFAHNASTVVKLAAL